MKTVAIAFAVSILVAGCSADKSPSPRASIKPAPVANAHAGKAIAERDCKRCHGTA